MKNKPYHARDKSIICITKSYYAIYAIFSLEFSLLVNEVNISFDLKALCCKERTRNGKLNQKLKAIIQEAKENITTNVLPIRLASLMAVPPALLTDLFSQSPLPQVLMIVSLPRQRKRSTIYISPISIKTSVLPLRRVFAPLCTPESSHSDNGEAMH